MAADQIEEIKQKLDIVDLVGSYVPLQKSGKNYKALCPFHSEKTPSFMVSPQLQIFKCFGCGEGGDVFAFYSKMEGASFGDSLKEMARRAGVKLLRKTENPEEERRDHLYQLNQLAADYFHYLLTEHKIGSKALGFLKNRGLSKESINAFNLGYAPSSWDSLGRFLLRKGFSLTDLLASGLAVRKEGGRGYFDFFRGRVIFPLRSPMGKVAGFSGRILNNGGSKDAPTGASGLVLDQAGPKYINTVDTPVFAKGRFLFNLDLAKQEIKKEKSVVLVEGEMDVIALYEKGIKNVVGTKGTALSPEQISPLARFAQSITICFDRDTAGLEATKKGILIAQSGGLEVRAILLPEGKDPDEAVRENPVDFKKALDQAPPIFDFYLSSALSRFDPATPSGKKAIAHEVLPILKSLANEVERAAYLAKLSEKIGIEEGVLWKQLEKEEVLESEPSPQLSSYPATKLPKKEAYLFSVLFVLPEEKVKTAFGKISARTISDQRLLAILDSLKTYFGKLRKFSLPKFSAKLDEEKRLLLGELTLGPGLDFSGDEAEEEFTKALLAVESNYLMRSRKALIVQIREAEKRSELAEVKRLQKEVVKLNSKIDAII